jgi:hypothetical protein
MTYDKGDRARLLVEFRDLDGAASDPASVTLEVKPPDAPAVSYSNLLSPVIVVRDGTGVYHMDIDLQTSGTWRYKWVGEGDLIAAEEGRLFVRPSYVD